MNLIRSPSKCSTWLEKIRYDMTHDFGVSFDSQSSPCLTMKRKLIFGSTLETWGSLPCCLVPALGLQKLSSIGQSSWIICPLKIPIGSTRGSSTRPTTKAVCWSPGKFSMETMKTTSGNSRLDSSRKTTEGSLSLKPGPSPTATISISAR